MLSSRKLSRSYRKINGQGIKPPPPDKRLDHFLSLSKDSAKHLSSVGLIWCVALLVSFLAIDSEVSSRLEEIRANQSKKINLLNSITNSDNKSKPFKVAELKAELNKQTVDQSNSLGAPISFPLPGLTPIPISPPLAPALWLLISCLVTVHLVTIRRHAHGYLALALSLTEKEARGLSVVAPYRALLAPLPNKDGHDVSAQHFMAAYGIDSERPRYYFLLAGVLCLLLAQLWMLWVQHTLSIHVKPHWFAPTLGTASLAIFGVTLTVCWQWLHSCRVPDIDFLANGQNKNQRREFIKSCIGASASISVGYLLPKYGNFSKLRRWGSPLLAAFRLSPRFRSTLKSPNIEINLPNGAAWNSTSKVVHWISGNQLLDVGTKQVKASRFKTIPIKNIFEFLRPLQARLRPSLAPYIAERILDYSPKNRHNTTIYNQNPTRENLADSRLGFLLDAIRLDYTFKKKANLFTNIDTRRATERKRRIQTPLTKKSALLQQPRTIPSVSIHLYDKFAKEAIITGHREKIKELVKFMDENSLSSTFTGRVEKWSDPKSKWSTKILQSLTFKN